MGYKLIMCVFKCEGEAGWEVMGCWFLKGKARSVRICRYALFPVSHLHLRLRNKMQMKKLPYTKMCFWEVVYNVQKPGYSTFTQIDTQLFHYNK